MSPFRITSRPPALLADEVGLGKTIEAGLVLSQRWAERTRRILVIRETPKLPDTFRDCHYAAGFILVDLDDDPCLESVFSLFDAAIKTAARLPEKSARFLHICVTIKKIESWFLADSVAINAVISSIRGRTRSRPLDRVLQPGRHHFPSFRWS